MNEFKSITIQLSVEESDRLEAEAKRLNVPPDALALFLLRFSLAQANPCINSLATLWHLRERTKNLPAVEPIEIVHTGREDLKQRGVF
jgi:hypothetical protein